MRGWGHTSALPAGWLPALPPAARSRLRWLPPPRAQRWGAGVPVPHCPVGSSDIPLGPGRRGLTPAAFPSSREAESEPPSTKRQRTVAPEAGQSDQRKRKRREILSSPSLELPANSVPRTADQVRPCASTLPAPLPTQPLGALGRSPQRFLVPTTARWVPISLPLSLAELPQACVLLVAGSCPPAPCLRVCSSGVKIYPPAPPCPNALGRSC